MTDRLHDLIREGEDDAARAHPPALGARLDRLHVEVEASQVAGFLDTGEAETGSCIYHRIAPRAFRQSRDQPLIWIPLLPVVGPPFQAVIKSPSPHEEFLYRVPGIFDGSVSHP